PMGLLLLFLVGILIIKNCRGDRWSRNLRNTILIEPEKLKGKIRGLTLVQNHEKEIMEKEIYESIAYLRNLIVIGKGKKVGSDFIISKLAEQEGLLQPIYLKMLSLLRINKRETAMEVFGADVGTIMGKNFGTLLVQWDEINPEELTETLLSYQKTIKEVRLTNQKKKDELISDLIYLPVVVNLVFIMLNFVYVGYFLEQKEMLEMLF
ncbi:MAG: hypothetical protein RR131_03295, partial [Anaerovorax sp.]